MVEIKNANNHSRLHSELEELKKFKLLKKLHESKQERLVDYSGEFEMVGNLKIGDQIRQTQIRFKNTTEFEASINTIDQDYESEDAIFNG